MILISSLVPERGSPSWRVGDAHVKHGIVDDSIASHEKVGQKTGDHVQVTNANAQERNDKDHAIGFEWVIIFAMTLSKGLGQGEKMVLGNGLEHSGPKEK